MRPYFIFVFLAHIALMLIPIGVEKVVELNVVEPAPIQVTLVSSSEDEPEAVKFVETEHEGVKEEVDTAFRADVTQKVEEQTVNSQLKVKGSGSSGGEKKMVRLWRI